MTARPANRSPLPARPVLLAGALPFELVATNAEHDAWFRVKDLEALADPRPDIADADVKAEFAARRAATRRKRGEQ